MPSNGSLVCSLECKYYEMTRVQMKLCVDGDCPSTYPYLVPNITREYCIDNCSNTQDFYYS